MGVGVVDVGANTARVLVADVRAGVAETVRETRASIGLGDEIERGGAISAAKIDEVSKAVATAVATAHDLGVDGVRVGVGVRRTQDDVDPVRAEELESVPRPSGDERIAGEVSMGDGPAE